MLRALGPLLFLLLAACTGEPDEPVGPATTDPVTRGAADPPAVPTGSAEDAPASDPAPAAGLAAEGAVHALANLGDSISQAFAADDTTPLHLDAIADDPASVYHDMPALSWIQGTDARVGSVASHYRALDPSLVVTPLSRSGAELVGRGSGVPNLEKQARSIAGRTVPPDLVYVLLGGNDVCNRPPSTGADPTASMYSVEEWRAAVVRGLSALEEVVKERATIRFFSMPRVDLLHDQVADARFPVTFDLGFGTTRSTASCRDLWELAAADGRPGICMIVTGEASEARRRAIGVRIDAYNAVLAEEVRRFAADPARNPKRIAFQSDWHGGLTSGGTKDTSGGTFVYESRHVSKRDCFHPSIDGQKAIAELALRKARWE